MFKHKQEIIYNGGYGDKPALYVAPDVLPSVNSNHIIRIKRERGEGWQLNCVKAKNIRAK